MVIDQGMPALRTEVGASSASNALAKTLVLFGIRFVLGDSVGGERETAGGASEIASFSTIGWIVRS